MAINTNWSDLPTEKCPRCGSFQRRSPGMPCRECGIESWNYGPVFHGYEVESGKRQRIEPWRVTF